MQRHLLFFITLFSGLLTQVSDTHGQELFTQKSDSLFSEKKYSEAAILYEELLDKHAINRSNAYLKLAYINETSGDFSKAIYFLSQYYQLNPNENIFEKISKMAEENSFSGYGRSDLNFLLFLYERYFVWVAISLFLLLGYGFYIFILKKMKNENTSIGNKIGFVMLIIGTLFILNLTLFYKQGIVKNEQIILRSSPSAGSEVTSQLLQGSRVNIIGGKDIWLRLLINGKIQFAKKSDFWIIDKE
jgi:tetratricopeptide (TPR) repeat protein